MKTKSTRILALLLACMMLLSLAACTGSSPDPDGDTESAETVMGQLEGDGISVRTLASALREEFADSEIVEYQESLWNLPRDHTFYVDLEFDIMFDTELWPYDIFAVYADPGLNYPMFDRWEIVTHEMDSTVPYGHNRLYISPSPYFGAGLIRNSFRDIVTEQTIILCNDSDGFLHSATIGETWGFMSHFYLALHVDPQTAEILERPLVTIFTVENSLEAPQSEFFVTEDGFGGFRWDEIEGADYYLIVNIEPNLMFHSSMQPIAKVTETHWVHPKQSNYSMNWFLGGTGTSEDALLNPLWAENVWESRFRNFAVIAVNGETHSTAGTIHCGENIAARLPSNPAWNTIRQEAEEIGGFPDQVPSIGLLPTHRAITMANGATVYRRIIYDFDAIFFEFSWLARIPYVIEGTAFAGEMTVMNADSDSFRAQLETVRERMEDTASRGGGTTSVGSIDRQQPVAEGTPSATDISETVIHITEDRIVANSALSAFLAHNMMAANEFIDLTEFPESANFATLEDAFFEAMYQNPLILHVEGVSRAPGSNILVVRYKESTDAILRQQDAIRQIVPSIIAEIITGGMTDLEKSVAINQFLIDTTEYDWGALENAEQNNFQQVDAIFNDSFTAYGILINRIGVCAGYAAAFRLLADEAGLESIVVTGYLEGVLPHAWNRVYIDGQWHTIDVTNNANEFLFNAFLHLPDDAVGSVLVEDSAFLLNSVLGYHKSDSASSEYFRITDRFFGRDDIAVALAGSIREAGSVTLRTDFDLDDDAFNEIAMEVMNLLNTNELFGFHWLGVIFMTDGR